MLLHQNCMSFWVYKIVREVMYEKEVQYKLADLKEKLILVQGQDKGIKTIKHILSILDNLSVFSIKSENIRDAYGITCPDNWYLIYVERNYFIFSKDEAKIVILKMYDNKQDFIYDLFGIEMRSVESKEYWGE